MKIVYDPQFHRRLKKLNVRIRKSFKEKILIFSKNPQDPQLNNHPLERVFEGYRSIDITADWRAVYKERAVSGEMIAYFEDIGTHDQLYTKKPN